MSDRRLLLFAKEPQPGRVKTRLIPRLGAAGAASLHEAFLRDAAARFPDARIYHSPDRPGPVLESLGRELRPQGAGDLGARLAAAFAVELEPPVAAVVAIGCDSPDLPHDRIERAFALLAAADVVLGPALDGGYYLLGARIEPTPLFASIPWGTADVLGATCAAIEAARLSLALLEPWYDVDRPDDLHFLGQHLELLWRARREDRCPHTRAHLRSLDPDTTG